MRSASSPTVAAAVGLSSMKIAAKSPTPPPADTLAASPVKSTPRHW
jgi:hypothetical protein